MATLEEYEAVHGGPPPAGKTAATEFGDGGCYVIYTGLHFTEPIGRWSDHKEAQRVIDLLRAKIKGKSYQLEPSHHMVSGLGGNAKCSACGRGAAYPAYVRRDWP